MTTEKTPSGRPITAVLAGGLGNQLFTYYGSLYASIVSHRRLEFWIEDSPHAGAGSAPIMDLENISIKISRRSPISFLGILPQHSRSPNLSYFMHQALRVHVSSSVGFDSDLHCVYANGGVLRGYFQTYKYFDYLVSEGLNHPNPQDVSTDYKQTLSDSNFRDAIVVHIRRGDYLYPKNSYIGALSVDYYIDAVNKLRSSFGGNRDVVVFTDDPRQVQKELMAHGMKTWHLSSAIGKFSTIEEMFLLGKGTGSVISNSTFSWWGARLGEQELTIAPRKWFKSRDDPDFLIPAVWMREDSKWISSV